MLMSSAEYRESLRRYKPKVFINGRRIESVADEPLLAPGIAAVGVTYDFALKIQYAELMTSVKKIGCGARWKAVMKNPKAGFDVDTLPKEKWYKIALLAEPTPEDKENRGRLGRCQHGKELSIGIEDRCKGDWKEIRIPAKRAMIERASIDDGISPDWVTKDFDSFNPSSYGESWSTRPTTLSSGRVVSYGWNPNSPKDAP